jgi:biopolymer transport protein ExbD
MRAAPRKCVGAPRVDLVILKPRLREEPEIQLIPLVDVVLLLLIFFMVSSTFSFEGRVKLQLPQADAATERLTATDPIVVTVTAQGAYRVNELTLINNNPETLRSALLKAAGTARKVPVTIRADARATHQSVVTAMDVIGRLGFAQINIATINERPGG